MNSDKTHIHLQYLGFFNTPLLWKTNAVFGLKQLDLPEQNTSLFYGELRNNLRLGKRVERFVSHQLKEYNDISILIENIQIQRQKLTLGELDCILTLNDQPIHLEVVYKFYLYDDNKGTSELEHWIGPNRKDSLIEKLNKLENKQLPLLYAPETRSILNHLNIKVEDILQRVYFKAQLFTPLSHKNISFKWINKDCIMGFYVRLNQLKQFSDCKFHMPTKVNWLMDVQAQADWQTYNQFLPLLETLLNKKTAPLCWVKLPNGELQKCFVVWWN